MVNDGDADAGIHGAVPDRQGEGIADKSLQTPPPADINQLIASITANLKSKAKCKGISKGSFIILMSLI